MNLEHYYNKRYFLIISLIFLFVFLLITIVSNSKNISNQHFLSQAISFSNGQLNLTPIYGTDITFDSVEKNGKYYWELGPFPSILMTPIVFIESMFNVQKFKQSHLNIFLTFINLIILYRISLKYITHKSIAIILITNIYFGSVVVNATYNSSSWYLSQSIALSLQLLALYEYLCGKKRYWIIGVLYSFLFLTRITAFLTGVFYLFDYLGFNHKKFNKIIFNKAFILMFLSFGIPALIVFGIQYYLNYVRFGSGFDNGYMDANIAPFFQIVMRQDYGLFKIVNIPSNFYHYFLIGLKPIYKQYTYHLIYPYFYPSPIGLSLFIVTPIFYRLLIFYKDFKDNVSISSIITSVSVLLILLSYYASGYLNLGPRYIIDIIPFLYLLLLVTFKNHKFNILDLVICILIPLINFHFWLMLFR